MLVGAIAGVDYAGFEETGQELWSPSRAVPDDNNVRVERLEIAGCVLEGFTLLERRGFGREVNDIGSQALRSQLEADAGARRRFDKEENDGFSPKGGYFLDGALANRLERLRGVQDSGDFLGGE